MAKKQKSYWPLIALLFVAILGASALLLGVGGGFLDWMHFFMGLLLSQFALLKIFHPGQFCNGFQMYDLLAKRFRVYGLLYPFFELILGLGFLSFLYPAWIYLATTVLMFFGSLGVISALKKGLKINCPCMGNILNVPLSTVTLTEDLSMGTLSLLMLYLQT